MLLITGLVLLFVLPTPWNVIVLLACILLWLGEVGIIWRFSSGQMLQVA